MCKYVVCLSWPLTVSPSNAIEGGVRGVVESATKQGEITRRLSLRKLIPKAQIKIAGTGSDADRKPGQIYCVHE